MGDWMEGRWPINAPLRPRFLCRDLFAGGAQDGMVAIKII